MNWIILIVAGLCEVGFTFCLGRAKSAMGLEWWLWIGGFVAFAFASMGLLAKATQTLPLGTLIPCGPASVLWALFWWAFFSSMSQPHSGACFLSPLL